MNVARFFLFPFFLLVTATSCKAMEHEASTKELLTKYVTVGDNEVVLSQEETSTATFLYICFVQPTITHMKLSQDHTTKRITGESYHLEPDCYTVPATGAKLSEEMALKTWNKYSALFKDN